MKTFWTIVFLVTLSLMLQTAPASAHSGCYSPYGYGNGYGYYPGYYPSFSFGYFFSPYYYPVYSHYNSYYYPRYNYSYYYPRYHYGYYPRHYYGGHYNYRPHSYRSYRPVQKQHYSRYGGSRHSGSTAVRRRN